MNAPSLYWELIRKDKQIQMKQMSSTDLKQIQKTAKISYYYPAEREDSCCGKGSFKSRFPLQNAVSEKSFCSKFCAFFCYLISNERKNIPKDMQELQRLLPIKKPIFSSKPNKITYTWIGHSTAVISIGDQANIMIDPVFSERSSPVQCVGPKRYRQPACSVDTLPNIHGVFVSHDHYDHLDQHSLNALQNRFSPIFLAGLDSKDVFPKNCKIQQFDWTETKKIQINGHQFQITFIPVCHWSKRGLFEKNSRLWGGFVIKTPKGHKIFYPGDTAYCQIFEQVGQMFGPFDLCIIPIGAYEPRHLLASSHIDPQEAVIIHKQLKSKKSVGVHWGTFPLGFQHYYAPKLDLQKAVQKHKLLPQQFITINHGDQFSIDYD